MSPRKEPSSLPEMSSLTDESGESKVKLDKLKLLFVFRSKKSKEGEDFP